MDRALLSASALVRGGKLFLPGRDHFDSALARVRDCRMALSLTEESPARSRQVEKYYWCVCIEQISQRTGYDASEVHALMKALHLPRRLHSHFFGDICWNCARVIRGSTTRLSNTEHRAYVEDVHRWSASDLGLVLPYPNEEMVAA